MDSFGNYPREKFDPFSVMLFKGLQVVAFLFFIALLVINPEAKSGKIDTKAEFLISASWPDSHPDDIDLYTEDPAGNIKPDKSTSTERIDGIVAAIMGISRLIVSTGDGSIYDSRGVRSV